MTFSHFRQQGITQENILKGVIQKAIIIAGPALTFPYTIKYKEKRNKRKKSYNSSSIKGQILLCILQPSNYSDDGWYVPRCLVHKKIDDHSIQTGWWGLGLHWIFIGLRHCLQGHTPIPLTATQCKQRRVAWTTWQPEKHLLKITLQFLLFMVRMTYVLIIV